MARFPYTSHVHNDALTASAHAICLEALTYTYPGRPAEALLDVSACIRQGERVALLGPNGAGKSTLLKLVAGLLPSPTPGAVRVFETPVDTCHPYTAYLAQRAEVDLRFPVSVRDVVMMGRYSGVGWFARPARADHAAVDEALRRVDLLPLAGRAIGDLSGGQQQRAFLARALAQQARLLLLDEPLAGLDVRSQQSVLALLRGLQQEGMTIVVSTHDLASVLAGDVAERVILLNRRIIADAAPDEALRAERLREAYA